MLKPKINTSTSLVILEAALIVLKVDDFTSELLCSANIKTLILLLPHI